MKLRGTEALTLEVGASLPPVVRERVPARFDLPLEGGAPRGSLLFFRMTGLVWTAFPIPFDYSEALWRVSVAFDGEPAWLALACDLDHPIVRALGARIVKYPTRVAKLIPSESRWMVALGGAKPEGVAGSLELRVSDVDAADVPKLRRTFVTSGKHVYEIPWDEEPPLKARSVSVKVTEGALVGATFGEGAKLDDVGVVHRGRIHLCGRAHRVS